MLASAKNKVKIEIIVYIGLLRLKILLCFFRISWVDEEVFLLGYLWEVQGVVVRDRGLEVGVDDPSADQEAVLGQERVAAAVVVEAAALEKAIVEEGEDTDLAPGQGQICPVNVASAAHPYLNLFNIPSVMCLYFPSYVQRIALGSK